MRVILTIRNHHSGKLQPISIANIYCRRGIPRQQTALPERVRSKNGAQIPIPRLATEPSPPTQRPVGAVLVPALCSNQRSVLAVLVPALCLPVSGRYWQSLCLPSALQSAEGIGRPRACPLPSNQALGIGSPCACPLSLQTAVGRGRPCACPLPLPKPAKNFSHRRHDFPSLLFPPQMWTAPCQNRRRIDRVPLNRPPSGD